MRTLVILTVTAITTAGLAYSFIGQDPAPESPRAVTAAPVSTPIVEVKENANELASAVRAIEQTNQERQTRLNKTLADLDARLRSVETSMKTSMETSIKKGVGGHAGRTVASAGAEQGAEQGADTVAPDGAAGQPAPARNPMETFVGSLDETLRVGFLDREATDVATAEAGTSIAKLPGVRLEDMQCGERFCRATLAQEDGKPSAISELFGEPPFSAADGFTIDQPDGRVQLYFARPGESLDKLRKEARKAAG